jgi:hypothetical protein
MLFDLQDKLIISWKYLKIKVHFIYLTYYSLATPYTLGYQLFPFVIWELWLLPMLCIRREHIASLENDPDSKFKVWFSVDVYDFLTIVKSKNHKLKHG